MIDRQTARQTERYKDDSDVFVCNYQKHVVLHVCCGILYSVHTVCFIIRIDSFSVCSVLLW